jgi:hypothetical protein
MKVEWILLAEGLGQDAKGAITAIGINQNVLASATLPAVTKRAAVAHLITDQAEVGAGGNLSIRFSVTSPSGKVITATTAQATIGPTRWPDLPVTFDFPVELVVTYTEYGRYYFEVTVQSGDSPETSGRTEFYVVNDSDSQT